MANCTRVTITKEFIYRGNLEQFSNSYVWKNPGSDATDTVYWDNVRDQILAQERKVFAGSVKYVDIYGWNDLNPQVAHVYYYAWPTATAPTGSFTPATGSLQGAGDQASFVKWPATLKSSRGKPVFFWKYFHLPWVDGNTPDNLDAAYVAALNVFAGSSSNVWQLFGPLTNMKGAKGYGPGANTAKGAGTASPYVTTRTLKRRGERPLSPAKIKSVSDMVLAQLGTSSSATTT